MVLKSIMFLVKSFLGNFDRTLAIFSGHTAPHLDQTNEGDKTREDCFNISSLKN